MRLSLWNHPTDTVYGMVARRESIIGFAEKLLGGEVYHYHSKMIMRVRSAAHGPGARIMASGIKMASCFRI